MELEIATIVISFIIAVILSIIIIPILKKLKVGQVVRDDGPKTHLSKRGVPTMGGIIMLITIILLCVFNYSKYKEIMPLVLYIISVGIVGFIDDFIKLVLKNPKGLRPSYKMLGLLITSVVFMVYIVTHQNIGTQMYIPILKISINIHSMLYIPFMIFILLATTNSVNLTDGLDGLATGVVAIIMAFFSIVGIKNGQSEVIFLSSVITGTCLGFLMFNLHPAKVMMGDTGSLALGAAVSAMAIYLRMPLILVIVAFVPVLEALSVLIQVTYFKTTGKRIFKMAPLHHHFELSGWKETTVVLVFWIVTLLLCILSLYLI